MKRVSIVGVIVAGIATLIFGCERSAKTVSPKGPQNPEADPLAQPKSLQQVGAPAELTREAIPPDNPQSSEKISLGQKLFFERRLSVDGTVSCSTCHDPQLAFTDRKPLSVGVKGRLGQRNAPTILNALYNKTQFWDGRVNTLEEQAANPIVNAFEMGHPTLDTAVAQIASVEEYQQAFQRVFDAARPMVPTFCEPSLPTSAHNYLLILRLIDSSPATTTLLTLPPSVARELFNTQARCNKCHALTDTQRDVTVFTDNDFHNIGIGIIRHNVVALARQAEQLIKSGDTAAIDRAAIQTDMSALGRFLITKKDKDIASFKTPDIRNVLVTGPYFHDGSQETLWDVIDHYNKGDGLQNPYLDEDIQPLALTETDIDDLVAFMASLTSANYKEQGAAELSRQRALSRTTRPQRDTARAFGPKPMQPEPPK